MFIIRQYMTKSNEVAYVSLTDKLENFSKIFKFYVKCCRIGLLWKRGMIEYMQSFILK